MNYCVFATLVYIVLFKSGSSVTGIHNQNSDSKGKTSSFQYIVLNNFISLFHIAPSGSDNEDNSPWYTFGYGSLLSSSSRIISECGLRGQQEDYIEWTIKNLNVDVIFNQKKAKCIRQKQAKQFIPAEIRGYRHEFYGMIIYQILKVLYSTMK